MMATAALDGRGSPDLRLPFRLTLALGVLLAGSALVGLSAGLSGLYERYPASEAGMFAQDLVVLFVVLPVLAASVVSARRGSVPARLAWAGTLFYAAYTYYFMVIGAFTVMFPAYVAIVAVSTYTLLALLFRTDIDAVARVVRSGAPRRAIAWFFLVTVALFVVLWGGLVASTLVAGGTLNPVQHLVVAIDGAILLPVLGYAGVQLLRRQSIGYVLAGVLIVKAGLTGFTLAFTSAFAMWWNGEVVASEAFLIAIFSVMTVVALAVWIPFAIAGRRATWVQTGAEPPSLESGIAGRGSR